MKITKPGWYLSFAHSALHRIQQDAYGNNYDAAEILSYKLHDIRRDAELLSNNIAEYVKEMENKACG